MVYKEYNLQAGVYKVQTFGTLQFTNYLCNMCAAWRKRIDMGRITLDIL